MYSIVPGGDVDVLASCVGIASCLMAGVGWHLMFWREKLDRRGLPPTRHHSAYYYVLPTLQ